MRIRFLLLMGLSAVTTLANADIVIVRGKVVDLTTQQPLAGIEVAMDSLEWKWWKLLPLAEKKPIVSMATDQNGNFTLEGEVFSASAVQVEIQDACCLPDRKMLKIKRFKNRTINDLKLEACVLPSKAGRVATSISVCAAEREPQPDNSWRSAR